MNSFSIVIPTYNRCALLNKALHNLKEIQFPKSKFEVILVDNNSTDNTKSIIQDFIKQYELKNFAYLFESRQGRTFASLAAISQANFSKIVFLDDDIEFSKNILKIYDALFSKYPEASVIGGKITALFQTKNTKFLNHLNKQNDYWMFGEVDYGNDVRKLKYPESLLAGNFSLNLKKLKGEIFITHLGKKSRNKYLYGEDFELCLRLELQHKQIIYSPAIHMINTVTSERLSLSYILKRYYCAGIERYIIDERLKKYKSHQRRVFSRPRLKNSISVFIQIVVGRINYYSFLVNFTKQVAFYLGYKKGKFYYTDI